MTLFASPHMLEPVVVIRQAGGSRDTNNGEWIPGSETRTEVNAVTAPANEGTWKHVLTEGVRLADPVQHQRPSHAHRQHGRGDCCSDTCRDT